MVNILSSPHALTIASTSMRIPLIATIAIAIEQALNNVIKLLACKSSLFGLV